MEDKNTNTDTKNKTNTNKDTDTNKDTNTKEGGTQIQKNENSKCGKQSLFRVGNTLCLENTS